MEKTKWIDIKGNHDSFNIPHLKSAQNYYRKYSGWRKDGSFHYIHSTPFGNYSFICLDATLSPGPKRPYNFFGILNTNHMEELSSMAAESHNSNQTIWFGHYPTSTIISPSPGIRTLMSSATAYLCGHLHTLGGLMPVLHSRHSHGTLELELGDWMDNRRYRLLAFDHDLLSFVDLHFEEWPAVLITNPKSLLYSSPAHEPLTKILHSTHIRILAFSPDFITLVKVSIDGVHLGDAHHVSGPLYVLKWNPQNYSEGFHHIDVTVQDAAGKSSTQGHMFAMGENLSLKFGFLSSFILLTDHYILAQLLFGVTVAVQIFLLLVFRYLQKPTLKGPPGLVMSTSFSLHVLSKTNTFYYSVLILSLYTVLGPWFVGEVIDGQIGACFSFGVFVGGHFLQGGLTFVVGILQMVFFNLPLMAYLCWCLLLRCQGLSFRSHIYQVRCFWAVPAHLAMALLLTWQLYSCYFLQRTYGTLAFFFSPMKTWLVVLTLVLIWRTWTLSTSELRTYIVEMKNCQSS
ncbi:transmembrane protein 62 isoform X1 [Alligator sinensis]|uniref:Transmembrane protein 62 isoform X1 n=2 Tax=Alligator sinensis TaxID=38654 RepID=A0A1U7SDA2_ALLSI|nr:transmembrane protein 62 isoform X1 [Alligator sinensis]XP_025071136.1 transmembrane protein 62 isoform X1 [Alligator sinensis]XP_025071137.1 transmembrane protein 62 isoform X1 [Alligator sinensis]XP_025071138.1 transmembrane protein 62 isoform X1 [Alligator sinensis]